MSTLLNFAPSILCFLGGLIFFVIVGSLFLPNRLEGIYSSRFWIHKLILVALFITLIWMIAIFPDTENSLLSGHFIWSPLTAFLSISLAFLSLPVFIYAEGGFLTHENASQDYYILGLLSLFGGFALLTSGTLLSFYLSLEIVALASYGMVGLSCKEGLRIEALIKYIVMGILSSILMLYGFCLLYFINPTLTLNTSSATLSSSSHILAQMSGFLLLVGLLFKLGAMPFHFWVPDIYQSAPITTTLFIASLSKFVAIGMGLRLFLDRLDCLVVNAQPLLLTLGLLSVAGGNLMAILQTNIRRLLAYSSISHMGFILLGLALPSSHYKIVLFYGLNYCFISTLLFGVLTYLSEIGFTVNTTDELKGLSQQYPLAALLIFFSMSAMAGIPPFIGFFSKLGLLYHLLMQGFHFAATIALFATVIGAYYYLTIIRNMYFEAPSELQKIQPASLGMTRITLVISGFLLLGLSLSPGQLIDTIEKSIDFKSTTSQNAQQGIFENTLKK